MKKALLILFLITSTLIRAQAYKPIPLDTNHYWSEYFTGWQGPTTLFSSVYKNKIKDTVVQSVNYKKVYVECFSPTTGCAYYLNNFLLRQDSVQRKVFVLINNQEKILYNFNKVLGDTLRAIDLSGVPYTMFTYSVIAVDSVLLLDNLYHKRFRYSNYNYVTEGVGGEFGLLTPYFVFFETWRQLICLSKINSTTTTIYMNPNYTQTGCTPFIMGTRLYNNSVNAKIFPNPVVDKLTITNGENYDFSLMDVLGKNIPINKIENNSIQLSHLPKGIYFLKVVENGKIISVEKIMKE